MPENHRTAATRVCRQKRPIAIDDQQPIHLVRRSSARTAQLQRAILDGGGELLLQRLGGSILLLVNCPIELRQMLKP